ncbi:MAG: T9SS type A sorting domain-containing protein [Flavobacteriales bacterium]|nr:T9SS type A sorting domain-containing protein [Flavobacteriales bacterium]
MRLITTATVLLLTGVAHSQCGPYKSHPVWPDTLGSAYVSSTECGSGTQITSVLWDNGDTDWYTDDLSVGAHSVVLYVDQDPVETLDFEIEQLAWDLNQNVFLYAGEIAVSIAAEVPYCPSLLFDGHHCPIDPDSTLVYLLQDGVAIDSLSPASCLGVRHQWTGLPAGHTYQTYVVDHSGCGSFGYGEPVFSYSLGGAFFELVSEPTVSGNDGSLTVTAVVPDDTDPASPPLPLTGALALFTWPDNVEPVGPTIPGTSGTWQGLAAGEYLLTFTPDLLCSAADSIITIGYFTGVDDLTADPTDRRVWPVPATDVLFWSGGVQERVWVTDLQGRIVLEGNRTSQLDIAGLVPGSYLVHFDDGGRRSFVKD